MKQNWKLICYDKTKDLNYQENKPFIGTFDELKSEINKINFGNYSYKILDFELINKPVETTNEQPQTLLKIICKNPKGCKCDTWSYIKDCKHSVEEISDSSNLWMIDGEDREG